MRRLFSREHTFAMIPPWGSPCVCTAWQVNDITCELDLMGLAFEDLMLDEACTGGMRSWVKRCIAAANKKCVPLPCALAWAFTFGFLQPRISIRFGEFRITASTHD